jgi:protein-S-isoprenylcysteine O-methyltransferase Ste14
VILGPVRALRHLAAIGLLPGIVAGLVPALLAPWGDGLAAWPLAAAGVILMATGVAMIAWTVTLFAAVGRGTLAPWDPTERLVVRGPYRHVRNPMISGVFALVLGEAALFGSLALLGWFAAVLAVNAVYLPLVEEPGLRDRFGEDYDAYRAHVPRWLPRPTAWEPLR